MGNVLQQIFSLKNESSWKVPAPVCLNAVIKDVVLFLLKEKIKARNELKIKYNTCTIIYEASFTSTKVYFAYKSSILVAIFHSICQLIFKIGFNSKFCFKLFQRQNFIRWIKSSFLKVLQLKLEAIQTIIFIIIRNPFQGGLHISVDFKI